jgi:hypothetical protein
MPHEDNLSFVAPDRFPVHPKVTEPRASTTLELQCWEAEGGQFETKIFMATRKGAAHDAPTEGRKRRRKRRRRGRKRAY